MALGVFGISAVLQPSCLSTFDSMRNTAVAIVPAASKSEERT
jgi:hypothetical protein